RSERMEARMRIALLFGLLGLMVACEPAQPTQREIQAPEAATPSLIEVHVRRDGAILMNGELVDAAEFIRRVDAFAAMADQPAITVTADKDASFGDVGRVFEQLHKRGMTKMGVIGGT